MKRLFILLLALVMAFALVACGGKDEDKTPSSDNTPPNSGQEQQSGNTPAADEPGDPNAPVSSVKSGKTGSVIKHDAASAQALLVSMGLPEYPGGEILYAEQWKDDNSGTVYIKGTTFDECLSYCQSLSSVSPAYADSNSNGRYINYACESGAFEFVIKFFEEELERSYKKNGEPVTDIWQLEIAFAPQVGGGNDKPSSPVIADGWETPEYPYGELVYTEYDDNGAVKRLYFNNTTIEECHEYSLALADAGYMEQTNNDIHDDSTISDKFGRWMLYQAMNPSSYIVYELSYEDDKMEHTVDTPDGEVAYQLIISNLGKN